MPEAKRRVVGICPFCFEQLPTDDYYEDEFVAHDHGCSCPPVVCEVGPNGIDESEVERIHRVSQGRWSRERQAALETREKSNAWWRRFYALPESVRMERFGYTTRMGGLEKAMKDVWPKGSQSMQEALYTDSPLLKLTER